MMKVQSSQLFIPVNRCQLAQMKQIFTLKGSGPCRFQSALGSYLLPVELVGADNRPDSIQIHQLFIDY